MKITLEIPDDEVIEVVKSKWMPPGVSLVRIKQDPVVGFDSELRYFVRDEWIKEENPNRVVVEFENESDAERFREEVLSPFGLPIEWHHADEIIYARLVEETAHDDQRSS